MLSWNRPVTLELILVPLKRIAPMVFRIQYLDNNSLKSYDRA